MLPSGRLWSSSAIALYGILAVNPNSHKDQTPRLALPGGTTRRCPKAVFHHTPWLWFRPHQIHSHSSAYLIEDGIITTHNSVLMRDHSYFRQVSSNFEQFPCALVRVLVRSYVTLSNVSYQHRLHVASISSRDTDLEYVYSGLFVF
jgi:hypothetical protein